MISREEALKYYLSKRPEGNHISDAGCKTIEIIFNSIGSCGECEHFREIVAGKVCNSKPMLMDNGFFKNEYMQVKEDWYCADFKRKKDGLEDDKC